MSIAITHTIHVLQIIVQAVPMGTNLALLQMMWTILNGSFLQSRGAIFPALKANGFTPQESRRIWQAFRHGVWRINECLAHWCEYVEAEGKWQSHEYEGYRPVAVDWTAFWRFKLKGWTGKMFHGLAGRALRGVGLGVVCQVVRSMGNACLYYAKSYVPKRKIKVKPRSRVIHYVGCVTTWVKTKWLLSMLA